MRIGEILIGASIIDAKALDDGLDYAANKAIPVGRALRALKFLTEPDLVRALDAQQAVRKGLDGALACSVLRFACQTNRTFVDGLKSWPGTVGKEKIPDGLIELLSNKEAAIEQTRTNIKVSVAFKGESIPAPKLIEQGDRLFNANQVRDAEKYYLQAKEQLEDADVRPSEITGILVKLANLYLATDRYNDALPLYQRVLQMHTKVFGRKSPECARALEDIGDLYDIQNKKQEAVPFFDEALQIVSAEKIPDVAIAGRLFKKLASVSLPAQNNGHERSRIGELAVDAELVSADKIEGALQTAKQSLKPLGMILRSEGLVDAQAVESLMFAQLLIKQGTIPVAVAVRALKFCAQHKIPLKQLSEAGRWVTDPIASDESYKQLVVVQERLLAAEATFGADSPEILSLVQSLGDIHLARKDRLSAEVLYRRALSCLRKQPQAQHVQIAKLCERLAQICCQQGKYSDAQPLLLKSLEARHAAGQAETIDSAKCLWLVAKVEVAQFNHATALSFLRSAKELFDKLTPGAVPKALLEEIRTCAAETGVATEA